MLEAEGLDKSVKHVDDSELLVKHQSFFHEYHGISREFSNSGKGWAPSLGGFARRNSHEAPKKHYYGDKSPPQKHVENGRSPRDSLVVWPIS